MNSDSDERFERRIDAIIWFMDHPESLEALQDELLKAYIKYIKKRVESEEAGDAPPPMLRDNYENLNN
jgi:hypothetical protein